MKQNWKDFLPRVVCLVLGLFILAFGIALSTKCGLGVSPSSGLAYLLSEVFPALSMGTFTTLMNLCYLLIQLLILRKKFRPSRLLQLLVVFLFGYFTDFTLMLVAPIQVENYFLQLLLCAGACAVMGLGLFLEVRARVISMASEGALSVIAAARKRDFGQIKIINDCVCVVATVAISLIAFREVHAVREGTIIAAVLVGLCTQSYGKFIHIKCLEPAALSTEAEPETDWAKDYPLVVTIEREFGSGGRAIGMALAEKLGIKFYDDELISKTAEETGLPFERVQKGEESIRRLAYALYNQTHAYTTEMSAQDAIFEAQRKVIRSIADRESCVIVGRLGAYILKERPNSMHIFISAKEEFRASRIAREYELSRERAMEMVKNVDALRHNYCRHFTGSPWGMARHYRLCVDTSAYGIEESLRIIRESLKDFHAMYITE